MERYRQIKRLGIFDSGIGGLSILESVKNFDCQEIIYIADTANLPYGDKTPAQIIAASFLVVEKLLEYNVDTIIVACHTASAIALPFLQEQFPEIQFIGMIEATIQATIQTTQSGSVALLATQATIEHGLYQRELEHIGITVKSIGCPELVPLIEEKAMNDTIRESIKQYTSALSHGIDTLILGCTHYDIITDIFSESHPGLSLVAAQSIFSKLFNTSAHYTPECRYIATGDIPSTLKNL